MRELVFLVSVFAACPPLLPPRPLVSNWSRDEKSDGFVAHKTIDGGGDVPGLRRALACKLFLIPTI